MGVFAKALFATVVVAVLAAGCGDDPFGAGEWRSASAAGVTLEWRVDGENLALRLSASTSGWVAVGFDPEAGMEFANIVIGYVDAGGVHVRDDWGTGESSHQSDVSLGGSADILDSDGTQSGGITTVEALIPMDSPDIFDKELVAGSTYTVILARGPDGSDNFTSAHQSAGSVTIEI